MAKSKVKDSAATPAVAPVAKVAEAPATRSTAGFYKKTGDRLHFAPTQVHFPGGTSIEITKHADYTYPVQGWSYYESAEAAYAAEGLEMPAAATRESVAARIAARKAMTPEQREAERAERDAARISRLQAKHPERAAKLQARVEERQTRLAQRAALAAMSPEERKAAHLAEMEKRRPELAAKIKANQAARAARLAARKR
jgi:hypothetical protein